MPHLRIVTVSIRVMSAGQGYRYLLHSVVVGDGDRDAASALTRYYANAGTPPGTWAGSGVLGLASLTEGGEVSKDQLRRLMGHGQHPDTGEPLGRPYRRFVTPQGSRTLVAEAVAYGIGRLIGAPVPANSLIEIPGAFNWEYAEGHRLRGGTGHGSLNVEDVVVAEEWGTYSRLDDNRRRQAHILALRDLCMGDDPQWLHQTTEDYSIWSFDHGLWLAGESDWTIGALKKIATTPWQFGLDPGVASASGLRESADRIDGLSLAMIQAVARSVPLEWETTPQELSELASILFLRTEAVAERLRAAANQSRHS